MRTDEPNDLATVASPIRLYILGALGRPELDDATDIFETGLMNSLFAVELVSFLEATFGILVETDDLDIANFNSVSNLASFVLSKGPSGLTTALS